MLLIDLTDYDDGVGHQLGQIRAIGALINAADPCDLSRDEFKDLGYALTEIANRMSERLDEITDLANAKHSATLKIAE